MHLNLPPGYHAHLDPEFLVLGRIDGSVVARFSSRGLVAEQVERAAWEDYGDAGGGLSPSRDPRAARLKRSTSLWHDSRLDTTGQEEESFRRHARSQTTTDHAHAYSTRNPKAS